MSGRNVRFLVGSFLIVALGGAAASAAPDSATRTGPFATPPDPTQVRQQLGGMVVPFQGNAGQEDPRVAYTARTLDGTLYVTRDGRIVHSFAGRPKEAKPKPPAVGGREVAPRRGPGWTLTETLVDARPRPQDGPASSIGVSRFAGADPRKWQREIPAFESVSLGEAWPGITVELAARGRNVEKLFTLAPGADVRRIGVRMGGAKRLALDADGALIAHTGNGPIAFTAPVAWQDVDGLRRPVEVRYALAGNRYGFRLGEHDPAHAVVIDPLVQYTYLGGTANDFLWGLAMTADGIVYAAGYTLSNVFPGTAGGSQPAYGGGSRDAFVAMFSRDLDLMQASFFGGNAEDYGFAVALGSSGDVYLGGYTGSANLPGTAGGAQAAFGGSFDGYVARFSADLKTLKQATFAGGPGFDSANAMVLDANDNVFLAGTSSSASFPGTAGGAQPAYGGGGADVTVVKLSPDLKTRLQSTYVGGNAVDQLLGPAMTLGSQGDVYVTGGTNSTNFPVTAGAAQTTFGGGTSDAFVVKLSNDLKTRSRATYLGGTAGDSGFGMAVDASENVHVVGSTASTNFPWVSAGSLQTANGGGTDGFIAVFDGNLAPPGRATYLGGTGADELHDVAVNPLTGNVSFVGNFASTDLPLTPEGSPAAAASAAHPGGYKAVEAAIFPAAQGRVLKAGMGTRAGYGIASLFSDEWALYYLALAGTPEATNEFWKLLCRLAKEGEIEVRERDAWRCVAGGSSTGEIDRPVLPVIAGLAGGDIVGAKGGPRHKRQLEVAGGFDGVIAEFVAPNYQGLWWRDPAGSESGWGINFSHQGSTIFVTWYTYDLEGKPWWLAALAEQIAPGVYKGDLFTVTGPPFNAEPFNPASVVETTIGTLTLTFTDDNHATFDYTVNVNAPAKLAVTQSKPITRLEFGTVPRCIWGVYPNLAQLDNYLDLWWRNPPSSESGWGINFTHQDDTIFATWFTYDLAGKPWWLGLLANKTAEGVYSGDVFTTTGPAFNAEPFNPASVVETTVGTATLTFTDGNNGTFAYTVNGVSQTKPITRQVFAGPGTGCG